MTIKNDVVLEVRRVFSKAIITDASPNQIWLIHNKQHLYFDFPSYTDSLDHNDYRIKSMARTACNQFMNDMLDNDEIVQSHNKEVA